MKLAHYSLAIAFGSLLVLGGCSDSARSETASKAKVSGEVSSPATASMDSAGSAIGGLVAENSRDAPPGGSEAIQPAILKVASLTVRADSVEKAERKAASVATQYGGFVVGSNGMNLASSSPTVSLTIKIPQDRFAAAVPAFEALGQRLEKTIQGEDVSTQIFDTDARIKSLRAEEESMNQLLRRATQLSDMISLRDRLTQLRSEIESLAGQQRNLRGKVAYSTLSLSLVQTPIADIKGEDPGWLNTAFSQSTGSAGELLRGLAIALMNVAVFSPFWLPPVLIVIWLSKRERAKQIKPPVY